MGKGDFYVYDTKSLIMGSGGIRGWPDRVVLFVFRSGGIRGWPDRVVLFVFQPTSIMVPSRTFRPDPKALKLPSCQRCEDKGLTCLEGPGTACYECNRSSAACNDWDPERGIGRAGSVLDVGSESVDAVIGGLDIFCLALSC